MLKLSAVNWACRIIILFCCAAGLLLSSCATEPSRVSETIPEPSPVVKETPVEDQPAPAVSAPVKPVQVKETKPPKPSVIKKEKKPFPAIGPLHHFKISGMPSSCTSGEPWDALTYNIRVTAHDVSGKVKTDYTGPVYFVSSDRKAKLPFTAGKPYQFTPQDKGTLRFPSSGFVMSSAGIQTVSVTDGKIKVSAKVDVSHSGTYWRKTADLIGFPLRAKHGSVSFKDRIWVIGGEWYGLKNDVWNSSDGLRWSKVMENAPFSAREEHLTLVFNNRIWVIGGNDKSHFMGTNDVWYTTDGKNWTCAVKEAPFSKRFSHTGVVFNGRMWVIGGKYQSDIWSSANGSDWTQAVKDIPFGLRYGQSSLVYQNRIWVIGGYGAGYHNDVWSSVNGTDWKKVSSQANFTPRAYHKSLVYGNKMWIIGGYDNVPRSDVWYSVDGSDWKRAVEKAPFGERSRHACAVFKNRMWVLDGNYQGDVWQSAPSSN